MIALAVCILSRNTRRLGQGNQRLAAKSTARSVKNTLGRDHRHLTPFSESERQIRSDCDPACLPQRAARRITRKSRSYSDTVEAVSSVAIARYQFRAGCCLEAGAAALTIWKTRACHLSTMSSPAKAVHRSSSCTALLARAATGMRRSRTYRAAPDHCRRSVRTRRLPGTAEDCSIERHGADVAEVMAALHLPPAILVGHSMGCRVVVEAALQAPSHTAAIVLVDGSQFAPATKGPCRSGSPRRTGTRRRAPLFKAMFTPSDQAGPPPCSIARASCRPRSGRGCCSICALRYHAARSLAGICGCR